MDRMTSTVRVFARAKPEDKLAARQRDEGREEFVFVGGFSGLGRGWECWMVDFWYKFVGSWMLLWSVPVVGDFYKWLGASLPRVHHLGFWILDVIPGCLAWNRNNLHVWCH